MKVKVIVKDYYIGKNYCRFCKSEIPEATGNRPRLYCNASCSTKWRYWNIPSVRRRMKKSSIKQNEKRRKDPKFNKKECLRTKKWIENNRDRFNKLMREQMRKKRKIKPENYRV